MMTPRRLTALAAVALVVIVAALWISTRDASPGRDTIGRRVLPDLEAQLDAVTSVKITSRGVTTTLARTGNGWLVRERDYAADAAKLRKLLLGLAQLEVIEKKTRNPANYAQLGVEDAGADATGALVEVVASGKTLALLVGRNVGSVGSFLRVPGEAQSLLASPELTVEPDPKHWIDTALADIAADRVQSVAVTPQSGPAWRATRDAATAGLALQGLPRGKTQRSPDGVTPVAAMLVGLHVEDVHAVPATDSGATPRVTLRTFDGLEVELHGRADGDRRFIRGSARGTGTAAAKEAAELGKRLAGHEFEIPRYKYDALFRPLSDFT